MRQFILCGLAVLLLLLGNAVAAEPKQDARIALLEVESLPEKGGWVVDQQFMDLMGSPYLLAHGLGEPVPDAKGTLEPGKAGEYRVWVRTRELGSALERSWCTREISSVD